MSLDLKEMAAKAAELRASDIFLKVGSQPMMRLNGKVTNLGRYPELDGRGCREPGLQHNDATIRSVGSSAGTSWTSRLPIEGVAQIPRQRL